MSNGMRPLLSQFQVEDRITDSDLSWNPSLEMTSGDQLCGTRLLSPEVQSIDYAGATTVTRVRNETLDDD